MPPQFGRSMRHLWELAPDATFLNHGSFGACPKQVLDEQDRIRRDMEAEPDRFFREDIIPGDGETALRRTASMMGEFVNAAAGEVAFVENATAAVQAVLRSFPLAAGDRVLVTDHTYRAVRLMVEARCAECGASPLVVEIPIPTSADEVVARITEALTPAVKLAVIDHITSPTALVLPLERILAELRQRKIRALVDGAHAVGQIPLDLEALQPDWYTSNAHKWLFAPKGTAFLYASKEVAPMTLPHVVSHYIGMGFPRSFDFIGTRDNSAWLCVPAALAFFRSLDPPAAWKYQHSLLTPATELLAALGAQPVASMDMSAAMRSFVLPQRRAANAADAIALMRDYWHEERIQTQAAVVGESLLLRVSAQVYVDVDDLRRLHAALNRRGWPERG